MENFEAIEKRLDIVLRKPNRELLLNNDGCWNKVVSASKAKILSKINSNILVAYLLSESSLFIWPYRILMITCGTTALNQAVPEIMNFVDIHRIATVCYERKNFLYPNCQQSDFEKEIDALEEIFPGRSFRLGPANYDHFHLFNAKLQNIVNDRNLSACISMQILMHHIDSNISSCFYSKNIQPLHIIQKIFGLDIYFQDFQVDGYFFEPCGFSMNAVRDHYYFTIHVTPQKNSSYASFETNLINASHSIVFQRMLSLFNPKKFSVIMQNWSVADSQLNAMANPCHANYDFNERINCELDHGYSVQMHNFSSKNN